MLNVRIQPDVAEKFATYPAAVQPKMEKLRDLILSVAEELPGVTELEESLKWGEPSYRAKGGSTLRIDWKEKTPRQYALYFQCTSLLVPTFRLRYAEVLQFAGNRAILLPLDAELPVAELRACIGATLEYHRRKSLPLLGL